MIHLWEGLDAEGVGVVMVRMPAAPAFWTPQPVTQICHLTNVSSMQSCSTDCDECMGLAAAECCLAHHLCP